MGTVAEERSKIEEWARDEDVRLRASNPGFNHRVQIVHRDGSVFLIMDAFLVKQDPWVVVFSEHQGTTIWHKEDLLVYQEFGGRIK